MLERKADIRTLYRNELWPLAYGELSNDPTFEDMNNLKTNAELKW